MSDYEDSDYEVNLGKRLEAEHYDCGGDIDDEFDEDDDDDGDGVGVADGDDDEYEDEDQDEDGDLDDMNEDEVDRDEKDKEEIIPSKRPKLDNTNICFNNETKNSNKTTSGTYSNTLMPYGAKILERFGHTHGKGLGKYEQGAVEPLEASDQKGKRGFGYHPKETIQSKEHSKEEKISLHEEVVWLENPYPDKLSERELNEFMVAKMGRPISKMDEETEFCNPEVLHNVLNAKSALDDIDNVSKIVSRTNPFESLRNGIFLNRAAMKMANMDKVFDYMFTDPKDRNGVPITKYDLLYFADVCAGPGGFSEYVFYRKKWRAKGFGFTLRKENDFKLDEFFAGPCETFEPHYGVSIDGGPGDGDIFKSENIEEFSKFVMENTDNEGVHFMMADGGFGLRDRQMQEVESKQLYLCQCLVALKIVRTNGNFVVKLFDIFTPFSVGLVYLMYRSFDRISIHKPNSSRPANSERYLVCQYKRKGVDEIARYLSEINMLLSKRNSTEDVLELVPISILKEDINFFEYIVESSTRIGERQVFHLKNIVRFAKTDDCDSRQDSFKEECLKYWDIPNVARTDPKKGEPNRKIEQLFRSDDGGIDYPVFLSEPAKEVENLQMLKTMVAEKQLDWYWMVVESGKQTGTLKFYLGLGRTNVYSLEGKKWCKVNNKLSDFQLPDGTLIYGEIAEENVDNPNNLRGQYRVTAFHIVDGLFLGGEDIRHKHITERKRCCEMFAKSLSHSKIIYRVKKLYEFNELSEVLSTSLQQRTLKNKKSAYGFDLSNERFIIPRGLLFFRGTKGKWCRNKSQLNRFYFFNTSNRKSFWEHNLLSMTQYKTGDLAQEYAEICAEFKECFVNRMVWWLDETDLAKWAKK